MTNTIARRPKAASIKRLRSDPNTLHILAGLFALTNMGQPNPELDVVRSLREHDGTAWPGQVKVVSVNQAVMHFCQQYMETDEHQRIFEQEGRMWVRDLGKRTLDDVFKTWPDVKALWDQSTPRPMTFKIIDPITKVVYAERRDRHYAELAAHRFAGSVIEPITADDRVG